MADAKFKIHDRVRLSKSHPDFRKIKEGDEGTIERFYTIPTSTSYFYIVLFDNGSRIQIMEDRLELVSVEEVTFTNSFPIDVFDHRIFYTKEWQDANYLSTTGTSL